MDAPSTSCAPSHNSGLLPYAEGSVLIEMGQNRVVCSASIEDRCRRFSQTAAKAGLPPSIRCLPRATQQRKPREIGRGGPSGRTHEIQRLIGRSLRAAADMRLLARNARLPLIAMFCRPMVGHGPPLLQAPMSPLHWPVIDCRLSVRFKGA